MLTAYVIGMIVIVLLGVMGFIFFIFEEADYCDSPKEVFRIMSLIATGTVFGALLWPAIVALAIPALVVYGLITAVRGLKNKSLTY